jgi:hypothetical protein
MAKILKILLILFLLGSLGATVYYANTIVTISSRASFNTGTVSTENSYVFASPVSARADGQETIRITIFVLSQQGLGIQALPVELETNRTTVKILPVSPVTDESGKAYFELSSLSPGPITTVAKVAGDTLNQKLTVSFY